MKKFYDVNRKIQQLEVYLGNLVSALSRGELPVNLKSVNQIVDSAIAAIPPILDLSQEQLIEVYADLPQLLTAYAIDATLSAESYRGESNSITFHRFHRGNYWIIATKELADRAWLVPNPLRSISFVKMKSFAASFDRETLKANSDSDNYFLVKPALVQILPIVEPLTWKLLERGTISDTSIDINDRINNLFNNLNRKIIASEQKYSALAATIEKKLDIHSQYLDNLEEKTAKIETKSKYDRLLLSRELDCQRDDIVIIKQTISTALNDSSRLEAPIDREVKTEIILSADLTNTDSDESQLSQIYQAINSEYYYNIGQFAQRYNVITVSLNKESIERSRGNKDKTVIFEETNRGSYWLFNIDEIAYLAPVADKYINLHSHTTTALSFDCHNYTPDYKKIQLVKPAIVSIDSHTNPTTWRLQERGEIVFL